MPRARRSTGTSARAVAPGRTPEDAGKPADHGAPAPLRAVRPRRFRRIADHCAACRQSRGRGPGRRSRRGVWRWVRPRRRRRDIVDVGDAGGVLPRARPVPDASRRREAGEAAVHRRGTARGGTGGLPAGSGTRLAWHRTTGNGRIHARGDRPMPRRPSVEGGAQGLPQVGAGRSGACGGVPDPSSGRMNRGVARHHPCCDLAHRSTSDGDERKSDDWPDV